MAPGGLSRGIPRGAGRPPGGPPPAVGAPSAAAIAQLKRAEARRQIQVAQQLKVATLVVVALLLLAAFPTYQWIRSEAQDPVFGQLDALELPAWAVGTVSDASDGSRWCIGRCRFRERTWASERAPEETQTAYDKALRDAGWRPRTAGVCPSVQDGLASCWKRDEYVLDMWIRVPICDLPPPRPTISAAPSPGASTPAAPAGPVETCPGALVTVKVFNAIGYHTTP